MKRPLMAIFLLSIMLLPCGCKRGPKKIQPSPIVWDRDVCTRCLMAISDRRYAAEIVNPDTGRVYKFDDIGCAILWLKSKSPPWQKRAVFFVTDRKTGQWLDARKAYFTTDDITPMGFGFGATKSQLPGTVGFDEMKRRVLTGETGQKRYLQQLKGHKGEDRK